jgi:short-subunit dehydrogenase
MNIIIGGTHGLGASITRQLQEQDEETFVVGRSFDEVKHGKGFKIDLSSESDAALLGERIRQFDNTPLNFFWISGYGYNGDFSSQESPEKMAAVNFGNVLPAAQAAFRIMLASDADSYFVVVSSTTGYKARKDEAVYAGTKHAQVGFTRSLGLESERLQSSVKVSLFMPGGMQTPFWDMNRPDSYTDFLDPAKVATRILEKIESQADTFYEEVIERGSL